MTTPTWEFPRVWDSTIRSSFVACPEMFRLEFIERIGPSATSVHLHFGATFASAMEVSRKTYYNSDTPSVTQAMAAGFRTIISEWGDYDPGENSNKSLHSCLAAFAAYTQQWPFDTDYIQPHMSDGRPAVEFSFGIPLPITHPTTGEPIIYAGRFDLLGEYQKQLFVVDEKTT